MKTNLETLEIILTTMRPLNYQKAIKNILEIVQWYDNFKKELQQIYKKEGIDTCDCKSCKTLREILGE